MDLLLPYKIGDLAESKTFQEGYRGAWFRCKVNDMRVTESGHLECYLEYIDYPGEDQEWIRLFQKNPACSEQPPSEQIMIRPSFPQWHWKDQIPEQLPDNDIIEAVDETWKIGDLVDWLSEGCYWSGEITKLLNEEMFEVELLKPPKGEGMHYAANHKDLRPTLDWSLEGGWTVPLSQANGKSWHVARVIHRISSESETSDSSEDKSDDDDDDGDNQDVQLPVSSSKTSQEASGSPIPKPSSAVRSISSLNAQKDATLPAMPDLETRSPSNPAPRHGTQPAVTSNKPGAGIVEPEAVLRNSIKSVQGSSPPEREAGAVQDQYLQKLDEAEGSLRKLVGLTRSEEARKAVVLASLRWVSEDASVETA